MLTANLGITRLESNFEAINVRRLGKPFGISMENFCDNHCVKSVRILDFSGPYFTPFVLNTGRYGPENLRIQTLFTECNNVH